MYRFVEIKSDDTDYRTLRDDVYVLLGGHLIHKTIADYNSIIAIVNDDQLNNLRYKKGIKVVTLIEHEVYDADELDTTPFKRYSLFNDEYKQTYTKRLIELYKQSGDDWDIAGVGIIKYAFFVEIVTGKAVISAKNLMDMDDDFANHHDLLKLIYPNFEYIEPSND